MYRKELDNFIRKLSGVTIKDKKSRTSYWRKDNTRFCKLEGSKGNEVIVFTDILYKEHGKLLLESEPDHEGRLKLRLISSERVKNAKELIMKRYS